jgi:N-formylglutamate amidohydrolase
MVKFPLEIRARSSEALYLDAKPRHRSQQGTVKKSVHPMPVPRLEATEIFSILHPEGEANRFIVNSPHSGEAFPAAFLARAQLSRDALRRASDLYVDRLATPLAGQNATVMQAHLPRSFLDLNREPFELDPRLIAGPLPIESNIRSLRVAGGLGTVPRVIGDQVEIYAGKLTLEEVMARIEYAYLPYHRRLHQLLAATHATHGEVVLIDLHSMPSTASGKSGRAMPDLVIGDRFGASAALPIVECIEAAFRAEGFDVERNQPYAGGYITEYYGRPTVGWHAIQVEINRALYMDETALLPHEGYFMLGAALERAFSKIFSLPPCEMRKSDLHFFQKAAE